VFEYGGTESHKLFQESWSGGQASHFPDSQPSFGVRKVLQP
jgi:hypothetical protein